MGDRQRARRIPDAEWEVWRQELIRLYVEENASRRDIIHIMANEHDFVITDTQLKHRFQKWDVKKYINDDDMAAMLALKRKRQALGKDIRFQYKGHDVEQERLERAYKRQKRQAASPTFIPPYIKVYISPNQSPQPASQAFIHGYSASQGPERQFNSYFNSQNMQASLLMNSTNDSLDPSQGGYARNSREPGFVEVTQISEDELTTNAASVPVNSCFLAEAVEGDFTYETLSTEATSRLDLNQASGDIDMDRPSRNGSTFSSGAWESLMNWSPSIAPSILADERSSNRLSPPRNIVPSPTTDAIPVLGGTESEGGSLLTGFHVQLGNDQPITCENFDASSALLPILLMKAHLEDDFCLDPYWRLFSRGSKHDKLLDTIQSEWLRLELDNIVCWISETVSRKIRQHQAQRRIGKFALPFEKDREPSAHPRRSDDKIETNDEVQSIGTAYTQAYAHRGALRVSLGNILYRGTHADALEVLTVTFVPKERRRTIGLCATFFNVMSEIRSPRISPRLRTFNVIPDDSEIISCIKRNDLNGLQTLFDNREASPTDVDSRGFSLLSYAIYYGDCEIFRLLLEGGADVQTCNTSLNPLDMVWAVWDEFVEACVGWKLPDLPNSIIRSIDQCMRMSDAALRYGCDIDNSVAFNSRLPSPLFFMVDYVELPPQELENALRYLCNIGYDIEERNSEGATLLLFEATQLCPSVISVLRFLMEQGADLRAVDTQNRGALHCALRVPDDWGAWDSFCTKYCSHHDIDHEVWARCNFGTESENYAEDYCDDDLTPIPFVIDYIPNDKLACDDEVQERLSQPSGEVCLPTTGSTRSGSHSSRSLSEHYINLDEAEDVDVGYEEDVEDEEAEEDIGGNNEDDGDDGDDGDDEALEIPEGYVLCNDGISDPQIIRDPLPILKTRLRFKLLTLLRAGCDPNLLDNKGNSPSDDARNHGLWPEWTWALLNAGYIFAEDSNRWVKRVEDEVSPIS